MSDWMQLYGGHTFLLYPSFHAGFTAFAETITGYKFEIFRHVIHFLLFEISDNNVDLVASSIMHSAKEHKFRKL